MITPFTYVRIAMIYSSTALSLIVIMLVLKIITVDELIAILGLEQRSNEAQALKLVISRIQEMSVNILEILSKLLNNLFSWAGVDVDLTKIKIDTNSPTTIPNPSTQNHNNGTTP
ncbi:MAG: hypothetical protein EBT63_00515 [Proteobacteria bacterium]|nr:hypothetical protein [Pseudomonadota bacterium]NCA27954.1 hypothetical protein [Pseudomonadota bacterium]